MILIDQIKRFFLKQLLPRNGYSLYSVNNSTAYYPDFSIETSVNYYLNNDQVFSALNKVSETAAMIPFYPYQVKPDAGQKIARYKNLTNRHFYTVKGLFDIKMMQLKALEDLPESDKLSRLLATPNPYQSRYEFFQLAYLFYLMGECFILKVGPTEGYNAGMPTELYLLPPQSVIIHITKNFPRTITGYDFWLEGQKVLENIPPESIIHIKRPNPCDDYSFRGLYLFRPAKKLLTRMIAEDDTSVAQIQNGGLPGIVFDESIPYDIKGQETLDLKRQTFYNFVNETANKGAPWFSGGKLGYIATGLKLADMEVAELSKNDFDRFLNMLKISNILFNSNSAATESNVEEQVRQMYTNACLPMVYLFRDKFNSELVGDFQQDKKQRFIDCDISEITELQSDMKEMADVLSSLPGGYTINELRQMFKWDELPDEFANKVLLKQGYSYADDVTLNPVDPNLINGY